MNQITAMFKESNSRMKKIMSGEYNGDQIMAAQREFEGQIKLANAVIQAYAVAAKNRRALAGLEKMNIMDEHTAIDLGLGDVEVDRIKCPEKGIMMRQDCLDFSSRPENYENCKECEHFATTRRLIVDKE